jgi:hypothetical protein
MNTSRFRRLALASLLAMPGFLVSGLALAQDPCAEGGALMTAARQAQAERAAEVEQHARDVYGQLAESPDWISGADSPLANCVADQFGDWKISSGSAIFDQIANKAKDKAIDKACAEQRKRVAEYTSQASGYLSKIKGYENIGSQALELPDGLGDGLTYDDLLDEVGGGTGPGNGSLPGGTIPGPGTGGIPGVSDPTGPGPGGLPGIVP